MLDAGLIDELVLDGTINLNTGVVVLDFNHPAFSGEKVWGEDEADMIRALGSVAKRLHEEVGLMCVYVNVDPIEDDDANDEGLEGTKITMMGREARERKRLIENEILIPFSDYELCIRNEGIIAKGDIVKDEGKVSSTSSSSSWADVEWELRRIVARALLPPPGCGRDRDRQQRRPRHGTEHVLPEPFLPACRGRVSLRREAVRGRRFDGVSRRPPRVGQGILSWGQRRR